jgi:hypothetical protein
MVAPVALVTEIRRVMAPSSLALFFLSLERENRYYAPLFKTALGERKKIWGSSIC